MTLFESPFSLFSAPSLGVRPGYALIYPASPLFLSICGVPTMSFTYIFSGSPLNQSLITCVPAENT